MEKGKIFSILGDSISTFEGYTPSGAVFYDTYVQAESGVASVEDTWWMKVIRRWNGILGVNHSLSGSMVSGNLPDSAASDERIGTLGQKGDPDVILVSAGCNDWGFYVLPQEFASAYQEMLHKLKKAYPYAEIWCATLPEGKAPANPQDTFFNAESVISKRIYSEIIRNTAEAAEVSVADLEKCAREYETLDGVHPNRAGMETLAWMWIHEMEKKYGK